MKSMEIKTKNNFKGLFASKDFESNYKIHKLNGEIRSKPTKITIEIGYKRHIIDSYGMYMNHSFDPSCKIIYGCIIAIKDIKKGEELTYNYNDNETKLAYPFKDNITGELISGMKVA